MLVTDKNKTKLIGATLAAFASCTALPASVSAQDVLSQVAALNPPPVLKPLGTVNGAHPDTSALRYYAVRGEQERVRSELARLKQLYPSWQQPENIFAEDNEQERKLWKLYSEGKTEKVKAEIAKLQELEPGYLPSAELLDKLDQRENRTGIAQAWAVRDWDAVIKQANANPVLLAGGDIELIWFVAEAYAKKERPEEALEAFTAAVRSANSQQERKATVQKAGLLLSADRALKLLADTPELNEDTEIAVEVRDAIVRGALARSAEVGEAPPSSLSEHMDSFIVRARMNNSHEDAVLIAWSKFGQRDWKSSHEWFMRAVNISPAPKAVEGAIMSAMRLGKAQQAAELAGKWLDATPEIAALFISVHAPTLLQSKPPLIEQVFLGTFAEKSIELQSGEGAEALAWYAFNLRQLDAANAWFAKAMEWEETETAVFGRALTASRQHDRASFDALKQNFAQKYPKVASLKYQVESRRRKSVAVKRTPSRKSKAGNLRGKIAEVYNRGQFARCLQMSRDLRKYGPLNAQDHQMRGWCLLGAKRPVEAEHAFATAVRLGGKGVTPSAYGQALAALRNGKTNEALSIANANGLTRKQRKVIDVELLTQRARAAFANKDYAASLHALDKRRQLAAETRDITVMRGWAHFHSGRLDNAKAIFASLDQQLSTRESLRGLNAVKRQKIRFITKDR